MAGQQRRDHRGPDALWGLLASATSPRTAIAVAGVLILATPLLLPRRARTLREHERELVASV